MTEYGYDPRDDRGFDGVTGVSGGANKAQTLVNVAGAAVSAALVVGMVVWGYKLMVRDVGGVPVIEAIEGAFRVQPETPGGMTAPHQGLHVNEIAAIGTASGPVDQVVLAPEDIAPEAEDAPWGDLISQAQLADATPAQTPDAPPAPQIDSSYADAVQQAAPQINDTPEDADPIDIAIAEALTANDASPMVEDAPFNMLRPAPRPARTAATTTAAPLGPITDVQQTVASSEVSIDDLPSGTRLVQLGAFGSRDVARSEWTRIGGQFTDFFEGKRMVIQQAVSGGKTFFRLRAEGFEDLADARRFCSALTAAQADCIPVEVR